MVRLVNFLLYEVGWLACVLGAGWHYPWQGMSLAIVLVGVHLWLATDRKTQLQIALIAAGVGCVIDTLQLWVGVFAFSQGVVIPWLPPPWMTVLWIQFATTFRYSMKWLSRHYVWSACFGFAGAPLAFYAGERLGAVEFLHPRLPHFGTLALLWSFTVPLLIFIADQLTSRAAGPESYRGFVGESDRESL